MAKVEEIPNNLHNDLIGKCVICGKKSELAWFGEGIVEVCEQCAVEILPRLIADVGFGTDELVWNKATYYYYRALTNQLENKTQQVEVSK